MTEADKLRKEYRESVGSTYNMKFEWYADWLEQQLIKARQQVNSVDLADVVEPKGKLKCGNCGSIKLRKSLRNQKVYCLECKHSRAF
jgi:late competence protein required for DNA uptake (superfamily II DNA/RNA helicase)